jgi:hypothetical protein
MRVGVTWLQGTDAQTLAPPAQYACVIPPMDPVVNRAEIYPFSNLPVVRPPRVSICQASETRFARDVNGAANLLDRLGTAI